MKTSKKSTAVKHLLIFSTVFLLLGSGFMFSQDKKDNSAHDMKNMKQGKDLKDDLSIVHKGIIDLKAIDKNKDGKVFQDLMDWNVLSDKPGKCPLCKMTLKEVTIKEAAKNLKENGFKVK